MLSWKLLSSLASHSDVTVCWSLSILIHKQFPALTSLKRTNDFMGLDLGFFCLVGLVCFFVVLVLFLFFVWLVVFFSLSFFFLLLSLKCKQSIGRSEEKKQAQPKQPRKPPQSLKFQFTFDSVRYFFFL